MDPRLKTALYAGTAILAASQITSARAQTQYPTTAVTGSEIVQNVGNPTGGFFTTTQMSTFDHSSPVFAGHLSTTGTASSVTNCGTSPTILGTDIAGQVTMGTGSPTTCTILFASAYVKAPFCSVDWQTNLGLFTFASTTNTIGLTQTSNSSSVVNFICIGQPGG
jgi:hypothetical protein